MSNTQARCTPDCQVIFTYFWIWEFIGRHNLNYNGKLFWMRSLENFRIKFEIGNKDSSKGVIYTFLMAFINFQPNLLPAEKSDSKSFDQI